MKRENLVLDTMCFRIFVLMLRKWKLQGGVGVRPVFERQLPAASMAEANSRLETLRRDFQLLEIEVEDLQAKFNNNMVTVGAEEAFFADAALLEIADVYGFDSVLETLFDTGPTQLVPTDKLEQVLKKFTASRVFLSPPGHDLVPVFFCNSSGWYDTVDGVEFYTDVHLPEDERFIPAGFAIVG